MSFSKLLWDRFGNVLGPFWEAKCLKKKATIDPKGAWEPPWGDLGHLRASSDIPGASWTRLGSISGRIYSFWVKKGSKMDAKGVREASWDDLGARGCLGMIIGGFWSHIGSIQAKF